MSRPHWTICYLLSHNCFHSIFGSSLCFSPAISPCAPPPVFFLPRVCLWCRGGWVYAEQHAGEGRAVVGVVYAWNMLQVTATGVVIAVVVRSVIFWECTSRRFVGYVFGLGRRSTWCAALR
jgi:hypothetical protein